MENYTKIINEYGTVYYYNSAMKLHRLDGPAVERADGGRTWWVNGKCHRLDGPAVVRPNGAFEWKVAWCLSNKHYLKPNHNRLCLFFILEPRRINLLPSER
jgi:hypothetical protein